MSKTLTLKCAHCDENFEYEKKEHTRRSKKGITNFFCSLSCARTFKNRNRTPEEQAKISLALSERAKGNTYAKKGRFTYYLNKARHRGHEFDLDDSYLESIWTGRCVLTGVTIYLKEGKHFPTTASLDRIDSSKGYIRGNVQFVAYAINLAKNNFGDDDIKAFISEVQSGRN